MTMKERIARALCKASADTWRSPPYNQLHTDSLNNHWRHKAEAVLDALREPTEGMKDAGRYKMDDLGLSVFDGLYPVDGDDAAGIWQAMIDAAKSETPNLSTDKPAGGKAWE